MLFCTVVFSVKAQAFSVVEIDKAFSSGDVSSLTYYFGQNITITINNTQSTYSTAQAQMVLNKFFEKNGVKEFSIEYAGKPVPINNVTSNNTFYIGNLVTDNGNYKVYLYLKPKNNKYVLQHIKIEK
jgi:ABC-type nitrate/sulfonate/bicarbonate transport system substrate-binding protein